MLIIKLIAITILAILGLATLIASYLTKRYKEIL